MNDLHDNTHCGQLINDVAPPQGGISDGAAALLAGILVMGLGGLIAGAVISGGAGEGIGIGAAAGVGLGLLIGRVIAGCQHVMTGALVTGVLPIFLCLRDAFRRGRFQLKDFLAPEGLAVMAGIFAAGAVLGGLLVGTRKLIVRFSRRSV
jgi:hypothetical protein